MQSLNYLILQVIQVLVTQSLFFHEWGFMNVFHRRLWSEEKWSKIEKWLVCSRIMFSQGRPKLFTFSAYSSACLINSFPSLEPTTTFKGAFIFSAKSMGENNSTSSWLSLISLFFSRNRIGFRSYTPLKAKTELIWGTFGNPSPIQFVDASMAAICPPAECPESWNPFGAFTYSWMFSVKKESSFRQECICSEKLTTGQRG